MSDQTNDEIRIINPKQWIIKQIAEKGLTVLLLFLGLWYVNNRGETSDAKAEAIQAKFNNNLLTQVIDLKNELSRCTGDQLKEKDEIIKNNTLALQRFNELSRK